MFYCDLFSVVNKPCFEKASFFNESLGINMCDVKERNGDLIFF